MGENRVRPATVTGLLAVGMVAVVGLGACQPTGPTGPIATTTTPATTTTTPQPKNACLNERDTVEIAIEAYKLDFDVPGDEITTADLLTAGILKRAPKYWDVVAGAPVPKAGAGFTWVHDSCVFA